MDEIHWEVTSTHHGFATSGTPRRGVAAPSCLRGRREVLWLPAALQQCQQASADPSVPQL